MNEPHIEPITRYVAEIRRERGDLSVPDVDPDGGGVLSRALILLEAPGGKATRSRGGSGLLSPDNNDQTAANFFTLREEAQLPRELLVHWNIVPWYVGSDTKIKGVTEGDIAAGRPYLARLIDLLPELRVVILMGRKAERGWDRLHLDGLTAKVLRCPHSSPMVLHPRPEARAEILAVLQEARALLDGDDDDTHAS